MASPQLKRLKIATFSLEKVYVYKSLKELLGEKGKLQPQKKVTPSIQISNNPEAPTQSILPQQ